MAVEELLLYFLLIPAMAYGLGTLWVRRTMRAIAERQLGFLRDPGTTSRFLVFVAIFTTPIVFGLVVFLQVQRVVETPVNAPVIRLVGVTFAFAAVLAVLSDAWTIVRWKAASFKDMFARVIILAVIPEAVVVWVLVVALLVIGRLDLFGPTLSPSYADALSRALEFMIAGCFAAPLAAFLANVSPVLNVQTFRKILLRAIAGNMLAVVCLALAIGQVPRP